MSHELSRCVAVANGKGGVGKTSLTASIGGLAARAGYKVLLVDLDPQGDLADDLGLRGAGLSDEGRGLAGGLLTGAVLEPTVRNARENLDVITGGEHLTDVVGAMLARQAKGRSSATALADVLAPLAAIEDYDMILIDTPPIDTQLQLLALSAARWLLIPTKADTSSIRGLTAMADRVVQARMTNPDLDVLGVVLFDVSTSAKRVTQEARDDVETALGGAAPLFEQAIRHSEATAREIRHSGRLVHELAEDVEGSEPFWVAMRQGSVRRLPGTAPALAADYVQLVDAILMRIASQEEVGAEGVVA